MSWAPATASTCCRCYRTRFGPHVTDGTFLFVCEMFKATRHVRNLDMEGNAPRDGTQTSSGRSHVSWTSPAIAVLCEDALRFGSALDTERLAQIRSLMEIHPVRVEPFEMDPQTDGRTYRRDVTKLTFRLLMSTIVDVPHR